MLILSMFLWGFTYTDGLYTDEFMQFGVGARALGMGNAFAGLADDPTAFYWNPAGLAKIKNRSLFLMYSKDFDTLVTTTTAAFVYPSASHTLGLALYWIAVPSIPITDSIPDSGYVIREWVNISDYITYFSYARPFHSIDIGINVKGIFRDWGITTGYGIEADCGLLSTFKDIKYGINFVNLIGSKIYWQDTLATDVFIPFLIRAGCALQEQSSIGKFNICLGCDISPEKRVAQFSALNMDTYLGAEYWWNNKFALRIGLDKGLFTGGCGIVYKTIKFDYGMKFHPELGLVKRLSGYITF
ncbi:MAG: PorV/PorQ family protein [Candidatus Stahlbacteria bacterium]|nr:PorV/PorQ family protein [Candidatus Stahlbacteria bacterium]